MSARNCAYLLPDLPNSIGMASIEITVPTCVTFVATLFLQDRTYPTSTFSVMKNLCSDVIVGQEFLKLHSSVNFMMNVLKKL